MRSGTRRATDSLTLCAPQDAPFSLVTQRRPAHTTPVSPCRCTARGQICAGPSSKEEPPLGFEFGSITELGDVGTDVLVAQPTAPLWM